MDSIFVTVYGTRVGNFERDTAGHGLGCQINNFYKNCYKMPLSQGNHMQYKISQFTSQPDVNLLD